MRIRVLSFAVAQVLSGGLTYVTLSMLSRAIGPEQYAVFVVLWTSTILVSQLLFVGFQYTATRFTADYLARGKRPMDALRPLLAVQSALTVGFMLVVVLLSRVLLDRLFSGEEVVLAAFVAGVVFYSVTYSLRSVVMGLSLRNYGDRACAGDVVSAWRCGRARLVLDLGLTGAALSVVAGAVASVVIAPFIYSRLSSALVVGEAEGLSVRAATAFALPALAVIGAQQIILNSPVIVLHLFGGDAVPSVALSAFFSALLISRIPQYVIGPVFSTLLPDFTSSAAQNNHALFRRRLVQAGLLCTGTTVAMAVGYGLFGQFALRVFDSRYTIGRSHLALLAAGVGVFLLADVLHLAMTGRGRVLYSAASWRSGVGGLRRNRGGARAGLTLPWRSG
ncbi:MAG: hypothetical protein WKH64_13055 [Chloroflexia bacterium]